MKATLYDYCIQTNNTELLKEWYSARNGDIQPQDVFFGSHKKVWWKCKSGHEWQAIINSRVQGCGCPVCSNLVIIAGINDLKTTHPRIAAQWHPTRNGKLSPSSVRAGSTKKYWWRCEQGHEWNAAVSSRSRGNGCPFCAGKKVAIGFNDLASLFPTLDKEWVIDKNLPLTPESVTPYSNKRVWWRCEKGHEWQAAISARSTDLSRCPYCTGKKVLAGFNDLATVCPKLAAEWNSEKNGNFTPEMVTVGSHKRVWWKCSEGHEWRAVIYSRTGAGKTGCPICAGRSPV